MLLEELTDVITRPAMTQRLAVIGKTAREVLADCIEAIELQVKPIQNLKIDKITAGQKSGK